MMKVIGKNLTFVSVLLLVNVAVALLVPLVHATWVNYPDLGYHLWDNLPSSLQVRGTVILYEHQNYQGSSVSFTDVNVNLADHNFNDKASSLKIDGTVTLWDDPNWSGWRAITFTSQTFYNDNSGTTWNYNPSLVKSSDNWDSRIWGWTFPSADCWTEVPDDEKYIDWIADGFVESKATDGPALALVAASFDQGYENNAVSDRCPEPAIRRAISQSGRLSHLV